MGFRGWITDKATKSAETVFIQTKNSLQKNVTAKVTNKGDIMFTVGKLGLLCALMFLTGKELVNDNKDVRQDVTSVPSININNYFNDIERSNKG